MRPAPTPIRFCGCSEHAATSVPEQSLTVREALRICTYNGAWVTFDEKDRGSLEIGKMADMVILSQNPYNMAPKIWGI